MATGAFELRAGPFSGRDLDVVAFRGQEGISRLYAFDILTSTRVPFAALASSVLGRAAVLSLHVHAGEGEPRAFSGIISAVTPEGTEGADGALGVTLRLLPRLWLLRRRRQSRVFQGQTVAEIVSTVLAGLDVPCAFRLRRPPEPKEYCLQYEESDLDFVTRLLAEEGIYYFFEPPAEGGSSDVVVFADDDAYAPIGRPALFARPPDGLRAPDDFITRFRLTRSIKSKAVLLKDFDHHHPRFDLASSAEEEREERSALALEPAALRVYDHAGHYQTPEISADRARAALEQLRRRAVVGRGESRAPRLAAGKRITLAELPVEEHNRAYAITRVEHRGRVPERLAAGAGGEEVYRNAFECVPAEVVYRPRRPRRVPRQVLETAIVVGPPGEEIHTDALGRVKVQFHWDLEGGNDDRSSCWVPVSQAWAGSGWGFQFIPRVGMEVLVSFLGGDTDKPVVTGCLNTPVTPPTHALPAHATRSGVRTRTTPGPDGHNEVSFEDRRGQELLHLHAARDMSVVVREEQRTSVGAGQQTTIGASQALSVGADRDLRVQGDLREHVGGARLERVDGSVSRTVAGSIEDRVSETVTQEIGANHLQRVLGRRRSEVGGDARVRVGGDYAQDVGGAARIDVNGEITASGRQGVALSAREGIVITSAESIRLVCGDSFIELGPEEIRLSSKAISIAAGEQATITAPGACLHVEKKSAEIHAPAVKLFGKGATVTLERDAVVAAGKKDLKLASRGASLTLDSDAALDGAMVKLNCGADAEADFQDPDDADESFIDVALTHRMPKPGDPTTLEEVPVPGARFLVEVADGRVLRGVLDGEGRARVPIPSGPAKVSFPDDDAGRVKPA